MEIQSLTHQLDIRYNKAGIPTRAISLMWNQRSVDTFLGLPFNIASYGLLLEIIANEVDMIPDQLIGNLGDVHLYSNHIEQAKEQIKRKAFSLPILLYLDEYHYLTDPKLVGDILFSEKVDSFRPDFFKVGLYESHPTIQAPLSN
jgi:thymidylate synthase